MRENTRKALKQEMAELLGIHDVRMKGNPRPRTGVMAKTITELREDCFICKTLRVKAGVTHRLTFVVSKARGLAEFKRVTAHDKKQPHFSPYGASLLDACFKNWD